MKLNALAHVCISTKDLDKTREFYCNLLGMDKVFEFKKAGATAGFYLRIAGDNFLEFFKDPTDYKNDSPLRHLCFETSDLKGLRKDLAGKGLACTEPVLGGDGSWQFWIKDPNGIAIEFHEYTAESSQKTGKTVEITW